MIKYGFYVKATEEFQRVRQSSFFVTDLRTERLRKYAQIAQNVYAVITS